MPSAISSTYTASSSSAATATPGARWSTPVIALNRCVVERRARRVAGPRLLEGRRANGRSRSPTPRSAQPADELDRAGQLGRDRHQPEPVEERLERRRRDVGRDLQVGRVVGAATGSGEERALQVEPERLGAVGRGVRRPVADAIRRSRRAPIERRRHGGRQERGHPVSQQAAGHPVERGAIAHRVVAAPAVDVDVDEAGADERAVGRPRRAELDRGDQTGLDRDPCRPRPGRRGPDDRPTVVGPRSVIDRPRTRAAPSRLGPRSGPSTSNWTASP